MIAFPISQGRFVNLVAFVSEPEKEGTPFPGAWVAKTPRDDEGTELWADRYGNLSSNNDSTYQQDDKECVAPVIPDSFQPEMSKAFEGWDEEVTALLNVCIYYSSYI